ncbi:5'-3' exonuclease H3TH domain-containing protein [Rhodococcus sp. IEGM 1408]|uniref:5'-3' exonuclease n=1 Tax=Rhodococcus sp. IEGM 1408 TaxID=3082220 RepID=UPI0029559ACF|nr:5'-3' exonuclease H3TH domain-containing protein [Rhodococcus sp. IEGM 1408]MDV8000195.1 5'-3' exonuclease H3TH domain-containing protein [Rhodococcus sp. IEGM 1408]
MSQGPLMVLDSAGLWFRAFHSVPEKITGPDGAPANAVRGFCDMVAVLVEEYSPSGLVAGLDREWRPDWRVELVPSYKAHRVGDDDEEDAPASLGPQVNVIREVLSAAGLTQAWAADAEADDVLAEVAARDREVLVVTGDRDLFQLASASTTVVYVGAGMRKRVAYTPAVVAERFDLPAGEDARVYADYAVLVGDASDGLPGVAGIGAKTAGALLREYGDLDGIVAAAGDEGSGLSARQRAAVLGAADYLAGARGVVTLRTREFELEFEGDVDGRRGPVDRERLEQLGESTGQSRAIDRLVEATAVLATA